MRAKTSRWCSAISKGYQGEVLNAYLALGYQHRFGKERRWAFEVEPGAGALFTDYRYYHGSTLYSKGHEEHYDDHLMWQRTDRLNWIGPNWLSISIGRKLYPPQPLPEGEGSI